MSPDSLISSTLITTGILIVAGGFAVGIYQIPIRISATGTNRNGIMDGSASIGWGSFSLCLIPSDSGWQSVIRFRQVTLVRQQINREKQREELSPDTTPLPVREEKSKRPGLSDLIRYLPLIKRVISEIMHHLEIREVDADVTFGAGDPVTTGLVYGYYHAIRPLITGKICSLNLTPDFEHYITEGEALIVLLVTRPFGLVIRITALALRTILPDIFRNRHRNSGRVDA